MSTSAAVLGLTVLCYLLGAVAHGANLLMRRSWLLNAGRGLAVAAALLHFTAIGLRCMEVRHAPFTTPAESLSLLGWIVCLLYLGMETVWKLSAAGSFALGLSFLLVLTGASLSVLDIERRSHELLVQSFHLFDENQMVIKTQAIIEVVKS